jgi:NAD(P)-dependent dehydrogenase (short-subunit alcohol dehydrogenase family)
MTVTDDNSIQSGIGQVTKLLPKDEGLNVLINNSGILSADQSFEKASRPVMRDHYDVMVIGPMKVTQVGAASTLFPVYRPNCHSTAYHCCTVPPTRIRRQ